MLRTGQLLAVFVLIAALAAAASAGPLIDPILSSDLPDTAGNLRSGLEAPRLLEEPTVAGGQPPVAWWDSIAPTGLGLGVVRFQSDLPRAAPVSDLLSPRQISITTFGLSVQSDSLWGGAEKEGLLRPYVGLGPAVFVTSLTDVTLSPSRGPYDLDFIQARPVERASAATLGLQAQAGLKYNLSRAWSIFGEYRLTRPAYGLSGLEGDAEKVLGVHRFQGGLSIQFR